MTARPRQCITAVTSAVGDNEQATKRLKALGCIWELNGAGHIGPLAFGDREDLELEPYSVLAALLKKLLSFAVPGGAPFELALSVPDSWSEADLDTLASAVMILGWAPSTVHVLPHSISLATAYAQKVQRDLAEPRKVLFLDV